MCAMCFTESGGRKINENKMLTSKKARYAYSEMLQTHLYE